MAAPSKFAEVEEGDTLGVEKTFTSEDMINTLQENNINIKAITDDFKTISKTLAAGEGTIGKLIADSSVYANINAATVIIAKRFCKGRPAGWFTGGIYLKSE
jgi:phospholipid/cholesterol/gamma-HCH transport system substrate-binding protein